VASQLCCKKRAALSCVDDILSNKLLLVKQTFVVGPEVGNPVLATWIIRWKKAHEMRI
jgi:hypothetical protein